MKPSTDSSEKRAAIVVFGAAVRRDGSPSQTLRRRVEAAVELGRRLAVPPLFVPTGGLGRYRPAESEVMARLLLDSGIAASDIRQEPTGLDTLSSARAVQRILRDWSGPILAVSSGYHLPRCVVTLRLLGLKAQAGGAARTGADFPEWRWRLREVPALPYDALLAFWHRLRSR